MKSFKKVYQQLNLNQKKAVNSLYGPVMVVAGPGTGKTQVLSLRIANIILDKKARPEEILALTFSDSAANSMKNRLLQFIGTQTYDVNIKTFHSFCNDIILDNPELFKQKIDLIQLDDLGKIKIINDTINKTNLKRLKPFNDPYYYKPEIISKISELKKEGQNPKNFSTILGLHKKNLEKNKEINSKTNKPKADWQKKWENYEKLEELNIIFQKYQNQLFNKGFYDFDDMIIWVLDKFKNDSKFASIYQEKFKYILSDEYQDTNTAQSKVIEELTKNQKSPNVFVVGDDDQSIYRFQGANLSNVLYFEKKFPNLKIIPININYRSRKNIVEISKDFIKKNIERLTNLSQIKINKNTKSFKHKSSNSGKINLFNFKDEQNENLFLVEKIKELHERQKIDYSEISVILRTNYEINKISELLINNEIPVESGDTSSILEKMDIQNLIQLLKAIENPRDNRAVYISLSLDLINIHSKDFYSFSIQARKSKISYLEYFEKKEENINEKIKNFFNFLLKYHKESRHLPAILVLEKVIKKFKIPEIFIKNQDLISLNRLKTFYSFVKNKNNQNPNLTLKNLLKDLDLIKEENISIKEKKLSLDENNVNVLTAHQSKGKEYSIVFIPHLYRGVWDGKKVSEKIKLPPELIFNEAVNQIDKKTQKENDERRLFFVALTRAKDKIYLSYSNQYLINNEPRVVQPSKFIQEIKQSLINIQSVNKYERKTAEIINLEFKGLDKKKLNTLGESHILDKEKINKFLETQVKKISLSPTSLNLYLNCPQKFKLEKLLLIPSLKDKSASLGTAIHYALEQFFKDYHDNNQINKENLCRYFLKALDKEVLGKDDFNFVKLEGLETLNKYFEFYQKKFKKPFALETSFNKVFIDKVLLTGKIDKIGISDGKNQVKVIDYKTKKPVSRNMIMGKTKSSNGDIYRQLIFYKLLGNLDKSFTKIIKEAEIDFVKEEKGKFKKESFIISDNEVKDLIKIIKGVIKKIKNLEFEPKKNEWKCKKCDFYDFCFNK